MRKGEPAIERRRRRWPWVVAAVGALLALAVIIVITRASAIASYFAERAVPSLEQRIGRKVTIGPIRVRLFPRLEAAVSQFAVSGADGEPALVEADQMQATVELWPFLRSFGREVRIDRVELDRPTVHLVKRANGEWSYTEVVDRLTGGQSSGGGGNRPEVSAIDVSDGTIAVVDRSGHGGSAAPTVALEGIDVKARDVTGGNAKLRLDAALGRAKAQKNIHADLALAPRPSGRITLTSVPFAAFRGFLPEGIESSVSRGSVSFDGDLRTSDDGEYGLAGNLRLSDLSLRGKPASGKTHLNVTLNPKSDAINGSIDGLTVDAAETKIAGKATFGTNPPRGNFDLQADRLDLDTILAKNPESAPQPEKEPTTDWLPSETRKSISAVKIGGRVRANTLTRGALTAENLDATGELEHGVFRLSNATARLFGGTLALSGTSVDLKPAQPLWKLQAKLDGTDLGAGMQQLAKTRPVDGILQGSLQLQGAGADWPNIRTSVTGQGNVTVKNATLATNLTTRFADAFQEVIRVVQLGAGGGAPPATGNTTQLGDLHASFTVQNGWLKLSSPLDVTTPFGAVHVDGRVGLDRALDLSGKVDVPPQVVQGMTAGRLTPKSAVTVPIAVRGNVADPQLQITMTPADVVRQLAAAGALPHEFGGIGGGPPKGVPVPHVPGLPNIPGLTAPPAQGSPK